jgi:hypothetical protein
MAYNPNLPPGQALAAQSEPVVLALELTQDLLVTGVTAQSALGNNILNTVEGTGGTDTVPGAVTYRTAFVQIVGSAGITSGTIIFEGSNNNINWVSIPHYNDSAGTPNATIPVNGNVAIAANTSNVFTVKLITRYIRCRISTAFTGGTIQTFTRFSQVEYAPRVVTANAIQANATALQTQMTPVSMNVIGPTNTTASTNAALVKASAAILYTISASNPTATSAYLKLYNKASAPTVSTDVPVMTIPVAAKSFVTYEFGTVGQRFATGLAVAVTGAITDADTTNAPAGVHFTGSYR